MEQALGEFRGTERYQVLRRIGEGGMGVVYEAYDRERGQRVALKTIRRTNSDTIYRLKREFRALADLSHPNLVSLYDLVIGERACFFTMELVEGQDLLSYVSSQRPARGAGVRSDLAFAQTQASIVTDAPLLVAVESTPRPEIIPLLDEPACDEAKLRAVLPQLGLGLHALHGAGKVHRDIKPSNLLVTAEGRVVLLDFGLVADVNAEGRDPSFGGLAGTVGYMAPEQAAGEPKLTPAVDWYAVGVVMYQALTGRLPFTGSTLRILMDLQKHSPRPPRSLVPSLAPDLDELCVELLSREPSGRPAGTAALRRLGVDVDQHLPRASTHSRDGHFAGREPELETLLDSLTAVERGQAAVVVVRAASGMGKSTLVQRFLDRTRARHEKTVVLDGRCYEREAVPYKAMDSLIDDLSNRWLQLPRDEAAYLCPRDAALLPTLFPVLGRVPALADAPRIRVAPDPQEARTRAFAALRETLQRLGSRQPLVLFIDDMQWADGDTSTLLADLMRPPDPPALLLVLATRLEGSEPVVQLARRMHAVQEVIDLGPLDDKEALGLALEHLGEEAEELARRVIHEAQGSPFFLLELARYLQGRPAEEIRGKGLDEVLGERIGSLGASARTLAEVVAVAGEPLTARVAGHAAGMAHDELQRQMGQLRTQRFVRAAGGRAEDLVEPYHDRVRAAIVAGMGEERRQRHHRALATALTGKATNERLARHWHGAGEMARAAEFARRAADEALSTLDFDRAANLYRMALDLGEHQRDGRRELRTSLASALWNAGRPVEASEQFTLAAADSDATLALELRRRAADALLRGGYVEEGLEATRVVLRDVGLGLPSTPQRALASMLMRRTWLRMRGLGWTPRPINQITQQELTRVDVCEGVGMGLCMVDAVRSFEYTTRFLQEALRLGEPYRVSRALALEADLLAAQAMTERAERLLTELERLTRENPTPAATAQLMTTQGLMDFFCRNRFRAAYERLSEATEIYRTHMGSAGFEVDSVELFICWSLTYLGELEELSRRVPASIEAAERRADRFASVNLRAAFPFAWLARGDVEQAERQIDDAMDSWPHTVGYQMQHLFALVSRCDLALYRGDLERAEMLLEMEVPLARRTLIDRPPYNRVILRNVQCRLALTKAHRAAPGSSERREALAQARKIRRQMARTKLPISGPVTELIDAQISHLAGDTETSVAQLRSAVATLEPTEAMLFVAPAQRALGVLLGGDEGAALVARGDAWLRKEGVKQAPRFLAMLTPGFAFDGEIA